MKIKALILNLLTIGVTLMTFTFCKKKTDLKVTVYNPYIQKYVKDAKISLKEFHESNFFTSGTLGTKTYDRMKVVASGYTDENGVVIFSNEKLRPSRMYHYFIDLTEIWGSSTKQFDRNAFASLDKGNANERVISDYTKGTANIQFNNLFQPAQSGDSICILPDWHELYDPQYNQNITGEGIENIYISYNVSNNLPNNFSINGYPEHAGGKVLLNIRKRKLGILTLDTMTIQFYPKQTTTIFINW
jgi:hypothetical protein